MYLGNGVVLTAAHVPGRFADTRPRAIIAGVDRLTALIKQGSLDAVDLTLVSVDPKTLPVRMRMRRLPLCTDPPFSGETVVVVTPESAVRCHVLAPSAVPPDLRGRFDTVIGDVATTGNSGSGVLDARKTCLLGVISRKLSVRRPGFPLGAPPAERGHRQVFCACQRHPGVSPARGLLLGRMAVAYARHGHERASPAPLSALPMRRSRLTAG